MDQRTLLTLEIERTFFIFGDRFDLLGECEINEIKKALLTGTYTFSAFKPLVLEKGDPLSSKFDSVTDIPGLPTHMFSIYIEPEDELVFRALAGFLNNLFLSRAFFLDNSFAYRKDKSAHDYISTIVDWGLVEMLLRFDLSRSATTFSHSKMMAKLKKVVFDKYIFSLISSFLTLPLIDKTGATSSPKKGVPVPTLLSATLLNFYLDEVDRAFKLHFPNLKYARYDFEIIIPVFKESSFNVQQFDKIMNGFDLIAGMKSITPGDPPMEFFFGFIFITTEGLINISPYM